MLSIPADNDNLCRAKAIVVGLAHMENNTQKINALRDRRRPALLKSAQGLHIEAEVLLGPCTYPEIAKFEAFLNVQIFVISSNNFNKVFNYYYLHYI